MTIKIEDLGLKSYQEVLSLQVELLEKRSSNLIPDTIILCSHPAVVTLGRASKESDLVGWSGDTFKTNRGGRATYHGPSQVVCYPILSLKEENQSHLPFKTKDIRAYLEFLEGVIIESLSALKITAKATSLKPLEPGQLNRGVWVEDRKIASIGVAIKKWCTMHGFALNVLQDPSAFEGVMGCGFSKKTYTSINEILEQKAVSNQQSYEAMSALIKQILESKFKRA